MPARFCQVIECRKQRFATKLFVSVTEKFQQQTDVSNSSKMYKSVSVLCYHTIFKFSYVLANLRILRKKIRLPIFYRNSCLVIFCS